MQAVLELLGGLDEEVEDGLAGQVPLAVDLADAAAERALGAGNYRMGEAGVVDGKALAALRLLESGDVEQRGDALNPEDRPA